MSDELSYHRHLDAIARADIDYVRQKDAQYKASWKRRAGVGAFFTIARPWDRFESISQSAGYDIFTKIRGEGLSGPDGSLIACIRDLRRYLLLVEAEMAEQTGATPKSTIKHMAPADVGPDYKPMGTPPADWERQGTPEDMSHYVRDGENG